MRIVDAIKEKRGTTGETIVEALGGTKGQTIVEALEGTKGQTIVEALGGTKGQTIVEALGGTKGQTMAEAIMNSESGDDAVWLIPLMTVPSSAWGRYDSDEGTPPNIHSLSLPSSASRTLEEIDELTPVGTSLTIFIEDKETEFIIDSRSEYPHMRQLNGPGYTGMIGISPTDASCTVSSAFPSIFFTDDQAPMEFTFGVRINESESE